MGVTAKENVRHFASIRSLSALLGARRLANPPGFVRAAITTTDALAFIVAAMAGTLVQRWYGPNAGGLFHLWDTQGGTVTLAIYTALVALALVRFWLLGHYTRRRPFTDETREMLSTLVVLAVADAALMYLAKLAFSRSWFLSTWATALLLVPLARVLSKSLLAKLQLWRIPTVVIGTGPNAQEAAAALHSERLMGLEVVAFAALKPEQARVTEVTVDARTIPVVYLTDPVADIAAVGNPSIVVALEPGELNTSQRLLERLHRRFPELSVVPALRGLPLYGMEVNHFFRHEALFLQLRNNLVRPGPRFLKRLFDVSVSATLLVLLSPLFAYIAYRIKQSDGPVFFGHRRIGRKGKTFRCYKFRSMIPNAQEVLNDLLARDPEAREEWNRDFKLRNDPRITPIGEFLRNTSLDELPQLWNVLRGDMSLVGPRPVTETELSRYGEDVDYYLEARPGMTGLWQISGRSDTDYRNRVYLDTWYVKNWSLWQDIVILAKTFQVVMRRTGAY